MAIKEFKGKYYFLSNYYPCDVFYEGIHYSSAETAFQLQKFLDIADRKRFSQLPPNEAKRFGRKVRLYREWHTDRIRLMTEIVMAKFRTNPNLKEKLIQTGNQELIEGNTWGDQFWGVCHGVGENNLGKILMKVRSRLAYEESLKPSSVEIYIRTQEYDTNLLNQILQKDILENYEFHFDIPEIMYWFSYEHLKVSFKDWMTKLSTGQHTVYVKDIVDKLLSVGLRVKDITIAHNPSDRVIYIKKKSLLKERETPNAN